MTANYLIVTLLLIGMEMAYEGIKLKGKHIASEWIEFFYLAIIWLVIFFWATDTFQSPLSWKLQDPDHIWKIILAAVFVRFAIGDFLLALFAGIKKPLFFLGSTKSWDLALKKLLDKLRIPVGFLLFIRFCFLLWGTLWLLMANTDKI